MTTRPIDGATAGELLRQMQTIRAFETRIESLFKAGELPGFVHSCAGQEAIAVGALSTRMALGREPRRSMGPASASQATSPRIMPSE